MTPLTLHLAWPHPDLNPNARIHWARKARQVKAYRAECRFDAKAQGLGNIEADKLALDIEFRPPNRIRRDRDNLIASFKAGADGIADACGIDDADFIPTYRVGEPVKGGAVRVTIEPRETAR